MDCKKDVTPLLTSFLHLYIDKSYAGCWKNRSNPLNCDMMTSSNENIFRVTSPLWGESTGHRRIPFTKGSDVELWCFLGSAPEQTVGQTVETLMFGDAIALIITSLEWTSTMDKVRFQCMPGPRLADWQCVCVSIIIYEMENPHESMNYLSKHVETCSAWKQRTNRITSDAQLFELGDGALRPIRLLIIRIRT